MANIVVVIMVVIIVCNITVVITTIVLIIVVISIAFLVFMQALSRARKYAAAVAPHAAAGQAHNTPHAGRQGQPREPPHPLTEQTDVAIHRVGKWQVAGAQSRGRGRG